MIMTIEEDVYRNWLVTSAVEEEPATETRLRDALNDLSLLKKMADIPLATVARKPPEQARIPWGIARVNAPAAWPTGQGEGIKVAVIDTGIDCFHPDLQCDFSAGINILDPDLAAMDDNEHGSHVSGTIAGRGIPGGVLGVAPKAELIAVKVLNQHGSGHLSGIIKGIHWAARVGVQVINLSLGSPINSPALERAVMRALSAGVVVVAAAGNSGPTQNTIGFPAGYPGVIAVAASDENDHIARFSSRGPAVGFAVSGVEILSTVPGGGYAKLSGTSMACPHVSGLAALAIERGALGPDGVRQKFSSAATKLCRETHCRPTAEQGEGIIDAARLK
jgi:subtilisin family serine protease